MAYQWQAQRVATRPLEAQSRRHWRRAGRESPPVWACWRVSPTAGHSPHCRVILPDGWGPQSVIGWHHAPCLGVLARGWRSLLRDPSPASEGGPWIRMVHTCVRRHHLHEALRLHRLLRQHPLPPPPHAGPASDASLVAGRNERLAGAWLLRRRVRSRVRPRMLERGQIRLHRSLGARSRDRSQVLGMIIHAPSGSRNGRRCAGRCRLRRHHSGRS